MHTVIATQSLGRFFAPPGISYVGLMTVRDSETIVRMTRSIITAVECWAGLQLHQSLVL